MPEGDPIPLGSTPAGRGVHQPLRLRAHGPVREMLAETSWRIDHLVAPLFVTAKRPAQPHAGLPALARRGVEATARMAETLHDGGVRAVLLFGIPSTKTPTGVGAADPKGPVPAAIRAIKERLPEMTVAADVCLCEYTDHGHCGILRDGRVDNELTLPRLAAAATSYAEAGADWVAPSAMADHQVASLRASLDMAGYRSTAILAYAAKFASAFYGPFRDVADSAPSLGDRRGYQLDPRNAREALRELELDTQEGADILMVKPALPYLDVIRRARDRSHLPLAAYQVSGEYAMIKAAASRGWVEEGRAVDEALTAIRRAGADLIVSYFSTDLALGGLRGR